VSFALPPICRRCGEEIPPTIGRVNERRRRPRVGFTPPPFIDAAGRKYPPNEGGKRKEMEAACRFHATPVQNEKKRGQLHAAPIINAIRHARNGVVGGHPTAPSSTLRKRNPPRRSGGLIELERGGVWFSRRLVGFWNKKRGRRGHERPPPSPTVFPASSFPLP